MWFNINFRDTYGFLTKIWNAGYSNVLGRFYGVMSLVLLFATFLTTKGFVITFELTILAGFFLVIAVLVIGFFYVKADLVKAETKSSFEENPQQMEMYKSIKEMNKDIQEIKLCLQKNSE